MNLQKRIDLLKGLGEYISSDNDAWQAAKEKAFQQNSWFIPEFINLASNAIATTFLQEKELQDWVKNYNIPTENNAPKNVGIVMAGNIPLVGFHDFLCAFISGHRQTIKPSSKDDVLLRHLVQHLYTLDASTMELISFSERLKGCDAYIATGSNNSARYFDYYFSKYPHIIRRNRTSVAVLTGRETKDELEKLADDVYQYFGLGCRNVTKIYVPQQYDFIPLLEAFRKYSHLADHSKYMNNYEYQMAVLILNKKFYMTNGSIILLEEAGIFSPISQLNYEYYSTVEELSDRLQQHQDIQCVVGKHVIPFGQAQQPCLTDYADGVDTLQFLLSL
jgi:hypothetical protein